VNPSVGFRHLSSALKDKSLRSVKCAEIGRTPGIVADADREYCLSTGEALARLVDVGTGFRCQTSIPSRRISCINGVSSRYIPARNGIA
jgi:hypothetical protein